MSGIIIRQYKEFLLGNKTQTRRLKLSRGLAEGSVRAVVPKYGYPAHWFGALDGRLHQVNHPAQFVSHATKRLIGTPAEASKWLLDNGFIQARLCVHSVTHHALHDITNFDAIAEGISEGINPRDAYAALWDLINTRKGYTWADNPMVYTIEFSRPLELRQVISKLLGLGHKFVSPFPLLGE